MVDAVVHTPFGSHPGEMAYVYGRDEPVIREWVDSSKTAEGAKAYLDKYVFGVANHQEYMKLIGDERLSQLVDEREKRV
jgi:glutaconate CoA-transferase subunit A